MKKIIFLIAVAIFLVGCGSDTPEDVALKFTENVYKGNTKELSGLIYVSQEDLKKAGVKEALDGKLSMLVSDAIKRADKQGGFKKAKVVSKDEQSEDKVVVKLEIEFKNDQTKTQNITVIKDENKKWKIRL